MKKEKEANKIKVKKQRLYLPRPLYIPPCEYLENNGFKKCTNKHNSDIRRVMRLNGKEKKGLKCKRCMYEFCPLYTKKQYCNLFK